MRNSLYKPNKIIQNINIFMKNCSGLSEKVGAKYGNVFIGINSPASLTTRKVPGTP